MTWSALRIGGAAGLRRIDISLIDSTIKVANNVVQVRGRPVEGSTQDQGWPADDDAAGIGDEGPGRTP